MKTPRYILIFTTCLLVGLSNTALSRPNISVNIVSIGSGQNSFRSSYRTDHRRDSSKNNHCYDYHKPRWCRRNYRNRLRINISRSVYYYDRNLGYCVASAPIIIERQTVIPVSSPQVVQVQQFDESTLQLNMELQRKKTELLEQLQKRSKEQRIEAIRELAGFCFDDKVRYALEDILLSDLDAELRKEAAQALGNGNNKQAVAALEKARVEDSNEDVRKAADEAINQLEGN